MKITSAAFEHNQRIPKKHTGEGEDISPPLTLSGIPDNAESLVLIVDDPDAPMGTFDHWILWNIDPETAEFEEGFSYGIEGTNHFQEKHYRGPLPPPGPIHRYFFKLYALDSTLDLLEGATKSEVEEAMDGHILDQAELIGTYSR